MGSHPEKSSRHPSPFTSIPFPPVLSPLPVQTFQTLFFSRGVLFRTKSLIPWFSPSVPSTKPSTSCLRGQARSQPWHAHSLTIQTSLSLSTLKHNCRLLFLYNNTQNSGTIDRTASGLFFSRLQNRLERGCRLRPSSSPGSIPFTRLNRRCPVSAATPLPRPQRPCTSHLPAVYRPPHDRLRVWPSQANSSHTVCLS